ncbi:MAG: aldehyde dehydrogenase family protein, partial [Ilumatobacteraceae bacterium]
MTNYQKFFINGKWVASSSNDSIQVFDSTDESVMATIPAGTAADVDAAAKAAHAAFDSWAALDVQERAKYMSRIGDGLAGRMDEIATAISRETGMVKMLSQLVQVGLPINSFKQAAAIAEKYSYSKEVGSSLVVREAIGVVGCITPWN